MAGSPWDKIPFVYPTEMPEPGSELTPLCGVENNKQREGTD